MAFSAFLLECVALYFQHILSLQPCVLCIYERVALLGVMIAGLLASIAPKNKLIRWMAILLLLYSVFHGVSLSIEHTELQLSPSPFMTCDFYVNFPNWLPLHEWIPAIFEATGDCAIKQWNLLGLEMPQWLIIIFAAYLLVAIIIAASQILIKK